ncbi:TetR family transcriptional regulator [Streptacidiphilus sp. PB12-B1b]|uniref:TetR/AcrR family transcriptional regulator C-terminal domain-containing protein n=1 Tax=Streptacidiphilus sp. PB12-B1b TaxID=2705012 RepID=UPI0015FE408D|nr:TetR/AcrR family transcriptional regulator C-terminal domain-containing protein [Streptacidiphilus sp. PB12-B1b]QMU78800.1 TetR family transcriptional regulator [Streptacidiphilus sp. PB12-B1b]
MLLRRADVLRGALELLDAEGLDGLTMRKLGAALNVQAGGLYRHFANKEALLDAMADQLLEGVGAPLPPGPWQEQVRTLGQRLRAALLARRDGARVVAGTYVTGGTTLGVGAAVVDVLCTAGLPADEAGWITFALFYYVLGHTIEEQAQARLPVHDDWPSRLGRSDDTVSPDFATALRAVVAADPGERFRYGLDVFLDGLALRVHGRPAPPQE